MPHLLLLAALSALLLSPGLVSGPSLDAAVFMQVAERMRDGATLYASVWDHKPPGIYLVLVASQSALPFLSAWQVSWLLSLVVTVATGWTIRAIARGLGVAGGSSLIAGCVGVVVMGEFLLSLGGGLTEPVAALPLAIAMLLALSAAPSVGPLRAAGVGALLAASLLLSVQAAAGAAAIAGLVVVRGHAPFHAAAAGIAGGVATLLAMGIWLAASGSLPAGMDAVLTYNGAYRAVGTVAGGQLSGPVVAWTLLALLFAVVPAVLGARSGLRSVPVARQATIACLAWLAVALVSFFVQGRFLAHYAIPLAIPLGVLTGIGTDVLLTRARAGRPAFLAPLLLTLVISGVAAAVAGSMEFAPIVRDRQRAAAVAQAIGASENPSARIWAWGNEPVVYEQTGLLSLTRFSYLYPLVTPGYATPALVRETLDQLLARPPEFIVDVGSSAPGEPGFQPLLISRPLASDGRDVDLLEPLRQFVRERYRQADTADGWVIYELRDSEAALAGIGSSHLRRSATRR